VENLQDGVVEEIEPVGRRAVTEVGELVSAEARPSIRGAGGPGSRTGVVHTLREVMRVRLAKFAACVLLVTLVAAVFAPWLAPQDPAKSRP
jgi:hypothetical protein